MDISKDWLEAVLARDARERSVVRLVNIETSPAVSKGDNYSSDMTRIKMDVVLGSGRKARKAVVVKKMPTTQYRRFFLGEMGLYLREIIMYRDILPLMNTLLEEINDKSEPLWGECLDYTPFEQLVLEDLKESGYEMVDRLKGMDLQHCLVAVKGLGKFHALSYSLKQKQLIPLDIFGDSVFTKSANMICEFYGKAIDRFISKIEKDWGDDWKPVVDTMREKVVGRIAEIVFGMLKRDDTKFNVVNHGDCWLNNMMFKHADNSEKPIAIKFVDLQLSFYNSPAFDLQYFFHTTPTLEVRKCHEEDVLTAYYDSLSSTMEKLGFADKTPSFETLKEDYEAVSFHGLLSAIIVLPLISIEKKEDVPDFEEAMKKAVENNTSPVEDMLPETSERVIEILKYVLKKAYDDGVFDKLDKY